MRDDLARQRHAEKAAVFEGPRDLGKGAVGYHEMSAARDISYRKSGLLLAGIIAVIYAVLVFRGRHHSYLALVAAMIAVMAFFETRPLLWMIDLLIGLGNLMQRVTNPLLFGLIYILAVVPTSFVLKLSGKDVLQLRYEEKMSSYWKDRNNSRDWKESFRKQY